MMRFTKKSKGRGQLEPIGALDAMHLWMSFDNNTSRVYASSKMEDSVDGQMLKESVKDALNFFVNFKKKVVIHKNRFWHTENDNDEVPVFKHDGKPRALCSDDTNRYPFYISYEDKTIHITFAHYIADGLGMYLFYETILQNYLKLRYPGEYVIDEIISMENTPFKDIVEPLDEYERRVKDIKKHNSVKSRKKQKAYNLDKCTQEELDTRAYIKMSDKKLHELADEMGVTPTALIMSVVNTALKNVFGIKDALILTGVMADARKRTGIFPLRNFSGVVFVGANADEMNSDINIAGKLLSEKLSHELNNSDYLGHMRTFVGLFTKVPGSVQTKISVVHRMIRDATDNMSTYQLSYMRTPDQSDWYYTKVKNTVFSVFPSASDSPLIEALAINGTSIFELVFFPERKRVTTEISRLFSELGIESEITENVLRCEDYFDLKRIETVQA